MKDYSHLGLNNRLRRNTALTPNPPDFNDAYGFNELSDKNLINAVNLTQGTIDDFTSSTANITVGTVTTLISSSSPLAFFTASIEPSPSR